MSEYARKTCDEVWEMVRGKKSAQWLELFSAIAGFICGCFFLFACLGEFAAKVEQGEANASGCLPILTVRWILAAMTVAFVAVAVVLESKWRGVQQEPQTRRENLRKIQGLLMKLDINTWQKFDRLQAEIEADLQEAVRVKEKTGEKAGRVFQIIVFAAIGYLLKLTFDKFYEEASLSNVPEQMAKDMNAMFGFIAFLAPYLLLIGIIAAGVVGSASLMFYTLPFGKIKRQKTVLSYLKDMRYQGNETLPCEPPTEKTPEMNGPAGKLGRYRLRRPPKTPQKAKNPATKGLQKPKRRGIIPK